MAKYVIDFDNCPFKVKTLLAMGWKEEDGLERFKAIGDNELEPLTADYINEHFGELQDEAYNKGLEDAWECARKIAKLWTETDNDDLLDMFGIDGRIGHSTILALFGKQTASEALAKLQAYEQRQEEKIEVGDEVIYNNRTKCVVFTAETDEKYASIFDADGNHYSADHRELRKTGKHYDIAALLEKMKGE